jgi:undecaprenyl diphosphate synthase
MLEYAEKQTETTNMLTHLAIIMDGNGRWAHKNGVPKSMGYQRGARTAELIIKACNRLGIKYVTVYAFSSENWQRPQPEVDDLMDLLRHYLKNETSKFLKEHIRISFIGERHLLTQDIQDMMQDIEDRSANFTGLHLLVAISYGAREEIRQAAINMAKELITSGRDPNSTSKDYFDQFLSTKGIPEPDLLIRTSGEKRISNFLLWQMAYTELYFTDVLWPDFCENDLMIAIQDYKKRERRYGK